MKTSNTHIINSFFLEISTSSKQKGYYLKDHINTFLKEELFPILETYFDTLDKKMPSKSIQIERLKMDLSINPDLDFNTLKREITDEFKKQIGKQIDANFSDTDNYAVVNNKEKDLNQFFSFLETGTNPWWVISKNTTENNDNQFEKIISEKYFGLKLRNMLQNLQSKNRFIMQLSDDQIYAVLEKTIFLESSEETIKHFKTITDNLEAFTSSRGLQQRNLIWDIILSLILKNNESLIREKLVYLMASFPSIRNYKTDFVLEHLTKHIENKSVFDVLRNLENEVGNLGIILTQKASEKCHQQNNTSKAYFSNDEESSVSNTKTAEETNFIFKSNKETEEENPNAAFLLKDKIAAETASDYYAKNAGLLLVHPFLKQLLENCKLLNKDSTVHDPEVAAHLLHYIATSQEQDYEHEMVFEKFLCNIPINQTINRNIVLPEELKNHADEMLQAVLENWPIMKASSVALLQNEYLKRPGKIILNTDNPKIVVERKTQDILLDKITWNLGIVKLAWKNKVIFVEW